MAMKEEPALGLLAQRNECNEQVATEIKEGCSGGYTSCSCGNEF